ncbi:cellulose synthase subunit BcsC-related outer membrane protein [Fundidesulfovibrio terrae]|uniref:cellulose synthase subunit BcsC-related outer membrane protein n=1 Tax=Fundidesulfovibrio terrae TaxID=2922866 RepID=UPI001FAEED40|nr:cellulose synthase subunit BcsC-related outer membrane protein [Fundidesulfovibrio terrae]
MKRYRAIIYAALLTGLCGVASAQTAAPVVERQGQGPSVVRESESPGVRTTPQEPSSVERSAQPGRRAGSGDADGVAIPADQLVAAGWERFKAGDWLLAEDAFAKALATARGETALRARLGLGYTSVRLGKLPQARENFQAAVDAGYNLQETLPALLTVLKAQGDREALKRYAAMLPESQRGQWAEVKPEEAAPSPTQTAQAPAAEAGVRQAFTLAGANPPAAKLQAMLARYAGALGSCSDADVFLKIAQGLSGQGQSAQARPVLTKLLSCPRLDFGIRLGAFYELAAITPPDIAREHLHRYQETAKGLTEKQLQSLRELAVVLDKKEMGQPGIIKSRRLELAGDILKASPGDPDARAALAWDALDKGEPAKAYDAFRALKDQYPSRQDVLAGLGYCLYHLGRLDEALAVASAQSGDPAMKDLAYQVYVKKAFAAVEAKDYPLATAMAKKAAGVWPEGAEVREVEGWTAFGKGDFTQAYAVFQERYAATGDKRYLSPMLLALSRSGQRVKAFSTAAQLAADANPEGKAAAAGFYKDQNAPILAASASDNKDPATANAATQMADAVGFVRSKTGDSGFSRLTEWSAPASYSLAGRDGWRLTGAFTPTFLSSGNAPAIPYAGSYYAQASGVPPRNSLITDLTVYTPSLSLDVEGPYKLRFQGGTTPLGGPIAVMPTFTANASAPEWEVQLHQKPVTESILSWVGQRDPYGSKTWGRVLRSGGQGAYVFTPAEKWFVSAGGGAEYIWGHNVADNAGVKGNLSAGRTFDILDNQLALGAFGTIKHYARNLNFYTFGNGGYYSPDLLFIAGPFVRLRSPQYRDYWFDLEGSVGYMYERTAGASKYPVTGASVFAPTSGQIAEIGGSYSGKSDTKFSYSAKGEALKLLTPYLAAGVFGGVNNAADFREAYGGLGLRLYLDPQASFWAPKGLFRYYTPLASD